MRYASIALGLMSMVAGVTPVLSRAVYTPYSGEEILESGAGRRVSGHGIDVWTGGMPDRRFKVIGVIRDERTDRLFDGSAIRSASIARLVRDHGGDAVLVRDVAVRPVGTMPRGGGAIYGTPSYSDQRAATINGVATSLAVVRYTGG